MKIIYSNSDCKPPIYSYTSILYPIEIMYHKLQPALIIPFGTKRVLQLFLSPFIKDLAIQLKVVSTLILT